MTLIGKKVIINRKEEGIILDRYKTSTSFGYDKVGLTEYYLIKSEDSNYVKHVRINEIEILEIIEEEKHPKGDKGELEFLLSYLKRKYDLMADAENQQEEKSPLSSWRPR